MATTSDSCFIGLFLKISSETAWPNDPKLGRRFLEIDQSEKRICLWRPCLFTDWDKMSNLYKRTFHRCFLPSFGSFGHAVSEEIFRNRPMKQESLVVAMFVNGIGTK
jgi:hypothetical protein